MTAPQQSLEEDDYSEDEEYSEDNEDGDASEEKKFPVKPQPLAKNMISPPSIANL